MDALTRSLQLLPERLDHLARELAELRLQLGGLQAGKADGADVVRLREQLGKLTGTVVRKVEVAEAENFNHFNSQLQALNALVAQKADSGEVERMDKELRGPGGPVIPQLGARLEALEVRVARGLLSGEAGSGSAAAAAAAALAAAEEGLGRRLDLLRDAVEAKQTEQQQKLRELGAAVLGERADGALLDQLNFQYRTLSTTMSQKVDWADMEHVKNQLNTLGHAVAGKAEGGLSEQLGTQYRAMCAVAQRLAAGGAPGGAPVADAQPMFEAPAKGLPPLEKAFAACMDQLAQRLQAMGLRLEQKAEKARVEQLIEQFQVLADLLAPRLTLKPQPKRCNRPQSARAVRPEGSRSAPMRADALRPMAYH